MRAFRYVVIVALCASVVAAQMRNGLNADVSWLLTVCERMLAGQQLYVDIYELNPPMSALLYLPFVWLAQTIGLTPELCVVAALITLALASCWFGTRLLSRAGLLDNPDLWWMISCSALLLLPGPSFGEREHIAVLLLVPLLATAALRSEAIKPRLHHTLIAGVAAGLAMTIKPHFALPIFLVAIYGAWHARSWRPVFNGEHVAAAFVLVGFWLAVWFRFPAFFETMLPISAATYLVDRAPLIFLLVDPQTWLVWLMVLAVAVLYRQQVRRAPSAQYLVAAIGFFLVYLIQGKGFGYHLLPTTLLISMVLAWCLVRKDTNQPARAITPLFALAIIIAPAIPLLAGNPVRRDMIAMLSPLGPGLKIANITSHLDIASPLHRDLNATLINSGPCLWITLGSQRTLLRAPDTPERRHLELLQQHERDLLRRDMVAAPPDIILAGTDSLDWLDWARADPTIAEMLTHYVPFADSPTDRVRILIRAGRID